MSLVQPQQSSERRPSPGLSLDLPPPINNPFRKGAASPSFSPSLQSTTTPPERPSSRNPFLDMDSTKTRSPVKASSGAETGDLLGSLSLNDRPANAENKPPPASRSHRPSQSHEGQRRTSGKPRSSNDILDIFADPPQSGKPSDAKPRNSQDSSTSERKPLDPEEERRRRERRHREREHRHKDSKGRPIPPHGRPKKPSRPLDIIDKLDVTSIYGTGLFHHDGPFDACNPHRNRKGSSRAPMQAFPKDSANNTLGGSGPVNKTIDIALFHGHGAEGFTDYSNSGTPGHSSTSFRGNARPDMDRTSFNPSAVVEAVHGSETIGLGTSTFLEGAPAPRSAIQRHETEEDNVGLARKKSLAQKIRGISNARAGPRVSGGLGSPEPRYERTVSPEGALSAGGLPKIAESKETNPFFEDYDDAYEKKGASIKIAQEATGGEPKPERRSGIERAHTTDGQGVSAQGEDGKSGGFLSRVKSLRGGGRGKGRAEKKE